MNLKYKQYSLSLFIALLMFPFGRLSMKSLYQLDFHFFGYFEPFEGRGIFLAVFSFFG